MFFISLGALLALEIPLTKIGFIFIVLQFLFCLIFAGVAADIFELKHNCSVGMQLFSLITSLGICLYGAQTFISTQLGEGLGIRATDILVYTIGFSREYAEAGVSIIDAICALYSVYILCCAFFKKLALIFTEGKVLSDCKLFELILYLIIFIFTCAVVTYAYSNSNAFFWKDGEMMSDIIYTSDGPLIVSQGNAFLKSVHWANDRHQFLFAIFSAPFTGAAYLISNIFSFIPQAKHLFSAYAQTLLLLIANFLLAKATTKTAIRRICFMLITTFAYSYMLFSIMIEQYIVVYFWLTLMVYQLSEKKKADNIVLIGAGGSMLASLALTPWNSEHHPIKHFGKWFSDMFKSGLAFVSAALAGGLFNLCMMNSVVLKIASDGIFKSSRILSEAFRQFLIMVQGFFIAPASGIWHLYDDLTVWLNTVSPELGNEIYSTFHDQYGFLDHYSWQVLPGPFSICGFVILALVCISFIVNRHDHICRIAFYWAVISAVLLLVFEMGATENGGILYSLYFGWAYLVLLFKLIARIEEKLHCKVLVPIVTAAFIVCSILYNVPAISNMLDFAVTYYPI
ncbi:MAG: hypothetical protein KBS79_00700 [Lachnospiraceae bacterium]|nr:hypothetical protein [Candidatus Minthocola equi]